MTSSIKELVLGKEEGFIKNYSHKNKKRFYVVLGDKWSVMDREFGCNKFYFTSAIYSELLNVCDAMNKVFNNNRRV